MNYIEVPEDVPIKHRDGSPLLTSEGKPFIFRHSDFVPDNICSHPQFGRLGGRGIRLQIALLEKFEKCQPGDIIGLETADYELVLTVIQDLRWNEAFVRFLPQVLAHVEAWEKAKSQDDAWKKNREAKKLEAETPKVVVSSGHADTGDAPETRAEPSARAQAG